MTTSLRKRMADVLDLHSTCWLHGPDADPQVCEFAGAVERKLDHLFEIEAVGSAFAIAAAAIAAEEARQSGDAAATAEAEQALAAAVAACPPDARAAIASTV